MGEKFTHGIRNGQVHMKRATGHSKRVTYAKSRGMEWGLSEAEYAAAAAEGVCFYCAATITTNGVGLDRKDNALGYVLGNVVACCYQCNIEKGATITFDEYVWLWKLRTARALTEAKLRRVITDAERRVSSRVSSRAYHLAKRANKAGQPIDALQIARDAIMRRQLPRTTKRDSEWRIVINERADKRACGLDVEAPWPALPIDGDTILGWRTALGINQEQAAKLLTLKGKKRHSYRSIQRKEHELVTAESFSYPSDVVRGHLDTHVYK